MPVRSGILKLQCFGSILKEPIFASATFEDWLTLGLLSAELLGGDGTRR